MARSLVTLTLVLQTAMLYYIIVHDSMYLNYLLLVKSHYRRKAAETQLDQQLNLLNLPKCLLLHVSSTALVHQPFRHDTKSYVSNKN